jgi:hypothetical protein
VHIGEDGEIVVDSDHPEVLQAVQKAVEEAIKLKLSLPAIDYIKVLKTELDNLRIERAKSDPNAPA